MLSLVIFVCFLGSLVSSAPQMFYNIEESETLFESFIKEYNVEYSSEEEKARKFGVFKQNLEAINRKNKIANEAAFGITKFTDWTDAEYEAMYHGYSESASPSPCTAQQMTLTNYSAPDTLDWRQQNKVGPVKNQQTCNSCWAFSATGNVEGQYAIKSGSLPSLSEAQLVDCATVCPGCDLPGCTAGKAIMYAQTNGGFMSDADYPFQPSKGTCRFDASKAVVQINGCNQYTISSEDDLKETLANVGPLSIAVDATGWKQYAGGIFSQCSQATLNHAVLLVGYGTENGTPFWIIKNSYGTNWGESGYIRLPRNTNACKIKDGFPISAVVA